MFYISGVNPIALRKAKIVYNFGLSECSRVKLCTDMLPMKHDVISIMQFLDHDIYHTERKDCFKGNSILYGLSEDHPWKNGCVGKLPCFVSVSNEKRNCREPANAAIHSPHSLSYSVIRSASV